MTKPLTLPHPHFLLIPKDNPISWMDIESLLLNQIKDGVSICLLSESGHENRGGYFFHIKKINDHFIFSTFDRDNVLELQSGEEVAEFINHVSGRSYSERMWRESQYINLRPD